MKKIYKKMLLILVAVMIVSGILIVINDRSNNYIVNIIDELIPGSGRVRTNDILLRFVVMSDSQGTSDGVNDAVLSEALEDANKLSPQPSMILMPGDLVNGATTLEGLTKQYEHFKQIFTKQYSLDILYPGVGNHEVSGNVDASKAFDEEFALKGVNFLEGSGNTVYYFDKEGSRFWVLNTDHKNLNGTVSENVISWINKNNSINSKHNFFFIHEPQFPASPVSLFIKRLPRDKLWQAIDKTNSPLVFNGHEHFYTRRLIDASSNESVGSETFAFNKSIYQVTVAGLADHFHEDYLVTNNMKVSPIQQHHYAIVDIYKDNKVITTVYNLEGKVIDKFELKE